MDLDDWEFVDFACKSGRDFCFDEKMIMKMDYFACASPPATPRRGFPVESSGEEVPTTPAPPSGGSVDYYARGKNTMKPLVLPDAQDAPPARMFRSMKLESPEFVNMSLISPRSPALSRGMLTGRPVQEPPDDQPVKEDLSAGTSGAAGMLPPRPPSRKAARPESTQLPPRSPNPRRPILKLHIEPEPLKENQFSGKSILSPRSPLIELGSENRLFGASSMLTPRSPSSGRSFMKSHVELEPPLKENRFPKQIMTLSPRSPVSNMENQMQILNMMSSTVSSPKQPCTGVVEPLLATEQSVEEKKMVISPEEIERRRKPTREAPRNLPAAAGEGSSINAACRRGPTGIKAIRSIGAAAAATLCIFALGAANSTKSSRFGGGFRRA